MPNIIPVKHGDGDFHSPAVSGDIIDPLYLPPTFVMRESFLYQENNSPANSFVTINTASVLQNGANMSFVGANLWQFGTSGLYEIIVQFTSNGNDDTYNGFYLNHVTSGNVLITNEVCGQNGQGNIGGNRPRGGTIFMCKNINAGERIRLYFDSSDGTSSVNRVYIKVRQVA